VKIHHRQYHLLVLDSELDDPYYSCLFINLYESIRKIVQRLQCVFNNLHKPINDNIQDQHAKYRTQSTTNPEIKESTVNTNYTGSSELADTAITDSTEIVITSLTKLNILKLPILLKSQVQCILGIMNVEMTKCRNIKN
jgi:hypothetical protein